MCKNLVREKAEPPGFEHPTSGSRDHDSTYCATGALEVDWARARDTPQLFFPSHAEQCRPMRVCVCGGMAAGQVTPLKSLYLRNYTSELHAVFTIG